MKQNLNLICEAKVTLGQAADEAQNPSGKIEARVTTWGAREGADGRKFNYQPEGFAQWADEFSNAGKPLPTTWECQLVNGMNSHLTQMA